MKKIGFLVHSRNTLDLKRKFRVLKYLPNKVVEFIAMNLPPITVSNITGLKRHDGADIDGYIIGITMTARQMLEQREKALKKIIQACKYAEKKGVELIGLGALTASLSKGGLDIVPHVSKISVTTGRAYTTKTVSDYVKYCVENFGFTKSNVRVAIVGAGGSIGSSCSKILAKWGIENILLIDLQKRVEHLKKNLEGLKGVYQKLNISVSHQVSDVKDYDIIITATNAPEAVLSSEYISTGAIIVNDAQPSDVPVSVIKERKDVLVIEGGVIHTPGIKCNFNLGLASREDTFCCLGEVLILAHNDKYDNYALGELTEHLVEDIENMSVELNFSISKLQNSVQKYIPEDQIEKVKGIIKDKLSSR